MNMNKHKLIVFFITLAFFILPFFWFKPGEMDLGGDATRLYFYDPLAYLKNYALYGISPSGFGAENIGYYIVPFVIFLWVLKFIFVTPTFLIAAFHGMSLAIAFLTCYGIVKELIKSDIKEKNIQAIVSISAGLLYVLSLSPIQGWDKVLVTHNQYFLNPLMFWFFLKYFKTDKLLYLLSALLVTFIFSPNFSFVAAPGFFAFYPLSILFLLLYRLMIIRKRLILKHVLVSILAFLLLQSFHIFPQAASMLSAGSVLNTTIFSDEGKLDRGLNYFSAIAPSIKVSLNLLNLPQMPVTPYFYAYILFPLILIVGFIFNRKKTMVLSGIFFFIILLFASANITNLWLTIYKKLFYVPGFAIFRNFYGQWAYSLLFFYTILFGQAFAVVLLKLKKRQQIILSGILVFILLISSHDFISGALINKVIWQSKDAHIFMKMDPNFEQAIRFTRALPVEGKVLTLPMTDPGYQIVAGEDGGIYQGPSMISYLSGKQDFAGYSELGEFKETFALYVKEERFEELKTLLGMLNIKYIFYNADPSIYDTAFPAFPYDDMRRFLPKNQEKYKAFIQKLGVKSVKSFNNKYFIYEIDSDNFSPRIFTTNDLSYFSSRITDWSVPLSFSDNKSRVFAQTTQLPRQASKEFIEIPNNSVLSQIIKNPTPPRFLHNAFAKTEPTSPFYPVATVKEFTQLEHDKTGFDYINNRMFLSAKLLDELELWGAGMPLTDRATGLDNVLENIKKTDDARTLEWELQNSQNSWESLLMRYFRNFTESINYINTGKEDSKWKTEQKFLLYEYILSHQTRFYESISGSSKQKEEKDALNEFFDEAYSYLLTELALPDLRESTITYEMPKIAPAKEDRMSLYAVSNNLDFHQISIIADNQVLQPRIDTTGRMWTELGRMAFPYEGAITISQNTPMELLRNAKFLSFDKSTDVQTIVGNNEKTIQWKNILLWRTKELDPKQYYLVTFDYLTSGAPYDVRFYEEKEDAATKFNTIAELFKNQLRSRKWTRYQAVFQVSEKPITGYLQIGSEKPLDPLSSLQLKNISLRLLPNPRLFVVKTKNTEENLPLPEVSFIKNNPTEYTVSVKNAAHPFYLVLNESFNNRWEALLEEKVLASNAHIAVNEYANAWYITPEDVHNQKDYTVKLSFKTQEFFTLGMIISLITFSLVLLFTVYLLLKKRKDTVN